jgi:hypothetical protein
MALKQISGFVCARGPFVELQSFGITQEIARRQFAKARACDDCPSFWAEAYECGWLVVPATLTVATEYGD